MATVADAAANAQLPIASALAAGVGVISAEQEITFVKYVRLVLPLDGFVFWVRADQLNSSALFNAGAFNTYAYNGQDEVLTGANEVTVKGSLHYATDNSQEPEQSYSANRVVFTATEEIEDLSAIAPNVYYIGDFNGLRFHFSKRSSYYEQSGLHHYVGDAVYSTMDTQIVDDPRLLDTKNVIVSNSLPIWLQLNKFFPVFPAYLVPDNLPPPYAAIHIPPDGTQAVQPFPAIGPDGSSTQLCQDRVRVIMYGCRNYTAQDYLQFVLQNSIDTDDYGLLNMPVVQDMHQPQVELSAIAQKKVIEFKISYNQSRMRDIARQLITSAFCALITENA